MLADVDERLVGGVAIGTGSNGEYFGLSSSAATTSSGRASTRARFLAVMARSSGVRLRSTVIVSTRVLRTSTLPLRSTIAPRMAGSWTTRIRLCSVWATKSSAVPTWRNHRRAKSVLNRANTTTPTTVSRKRLLASLTPTASAWPPILAGRTAGRGAPGPDPAHHRAGPGQRWAYSGSPQAHRTKGNTASATTAS